MWNKAMESAAGRKHLSKAIATGVLASLLTISSLQVYAAPGMIAQTPLFVAKGVQPNIFFLLDDSGSMDWEVLIRAGTGNQGGSGDLDFTPNDDTEEIEHCFGYNVLAYDPSATYEPWAGVDVNGDEFADEDPNNARVNPYTGENNSGACDDWGDVYNTNGTTCDLISGFPEGKGAFYQPWNDSDNDGLYDNGECSTSAANRVYISTLSAAQQVNYANWFSYYRKREYVMKRAVSQIVSNSTERMGLATINRNNNISKGNEIGTQVKNIDDETLPVNATAVADKATLLDNLAGINSSGGTPLRRGLQHVGEYFMGNMNDSDLFGFTPSNQVDSASGHSPILSEDLGGTCQQNFALVMSDGYWNGGDPTVGNADGDVSSDYDGQSYADATSNTLADVAMRFYETDLLTSLADEVPAVAIDVAPGDKTECDAANIRDAADHPNCFDNNPEQHLVTFTVAFGVTGRIPSTDGSGNACIPNHRGTSLASQNWPTVCNASLANGWPQPSANNSTTVDDMKHAAWNGRGQFLSASNPQELIDQLEAAIDEISSRQTVAAAAVEFDGTSISDGGNIYLSKFDSDTWSGELYQYEVVNGVIQPPVLFHDKLDARAYNSRIAVTYSGVGTVKGIPFNFPSDYTNPGANDLTQAHINDLLYHAPNDISATLTAAQIAENQAYGESLVNYLLGDQSNASRDADTFRFRDGHKLGDIVNSSPVYVGDPDPDYDTSASYQTWANTTAKGRQEMVYVGANDGALHAFDVETGEEVFAYFPKAVFSDEETGGLHWLAKQNYEHRYYVDGDIVVQEVYADLTGGSSKKWNTVLIGTLRGGGKSIFAIDVSDPSEFSTQAGVAGNILWEFSHDDLGYTFGKPTIAKLNDNRWAVIFGNGYNPSGPATTGEAALFIKYLDKPDQDPVIIRTAGFGDIDATSQDCLNAASTCNGLSTPAVVDLGADNVADRVYAGDIMGNMWVFDLSSTDPGLWGIEDNSPLFTARSAGGAEQPITSRPYIVRHPTQRHGSTSPNTMVFFGTGQYLAENDGASTGENSFYGIWDQGSSKHIGTSRDSVLVSQSSDPGTASGREVRLISDNIVDYTDGTTRGWYYDFPDTGERLVYNPFVVGELVIYRTIVPESNLCSGDAGYGWLMAHNMADGTQPDFIALDVSGDGIFNSDDQAGSENPGGIKTDGISDIKIVPDKHAQGEIITPNDSMDPSLDRQRFQYDDKSRSRSSWGRFRKDYQ